MSTEQFPVNRELALIGGKWRSQLYCMLEKDTKYF